MNSRRLIALPGGLARQMEALWARQAADWPRLAEGIASLGKARVKSFQAGGGVLMVQSNPVRMASAAAKVDAASLAARPCFLCPVNLPGEQLAVAFCDDWLVLCNPAPIFEPHFVLSSVKHLPQRIAPVLATILDLAVELAGEYTIFYNGPACGASAPDHLHIQAVRTGVLPFEIELRRAIEGRESWIEWLHRSPVGVGLTGDGRLAAVILTGGDPAAVAGVLAGVIASLGCVYPAEPEPMVNLFALQAAGGLLVYLFPRSRHRPVSYGQGPEQFLVSPGCVDLAGVLIAPRTEDFARLTARTASALLHEVLLAPDDFARLRATLNASA